MYLAYGIKGIRCEALYSILSYLKHNTEDLAQITIYTDDVAFFKSFLKNLPINYETLSQKQITSWRGNINYVHRLKLESIINFASKNNGNFLFLDSDTVIKSNLSSIFNSIEKGELILQFDEGKVKDNNPKTYKFIKRNNFVLTDANIPVKQDFVMYNSGAVGFNNSKIDLLKKALRLTDNIYLDFKHFLTEQFSISYYFQENNLPITIEGKIYHYWYFKEFRPILISFFEKYKTISIGKLIDKIDLINPEILSVPILEYKAMNFWQKAIQKIKLGKKWQLPDYDL